jgi:hypothetical protein
MTPATEGNDAARQRNGNALRRQPVDGEALEMQTAAAVALIVLRRALVEGAQVTREAIVLEASVAFGASGPDALSRLDAQAQRAGVSGLF